MEIIRISLNYQVKLDNLSLCLGYFDALHLGHLSLINKAKNLNTKVGVLTMNPNPSSFFSNDVKEVNSIEDKIEILESVGVDYFIILETNKELLSISKEDFVSKILLPLGVKNIVCGFDYHFGKERSGNPEYLKSRSEFNTYVCEEVLIDDTKVSTTLIKELLSLGEVKKVNSLLTRDYQIKGKVIQGNSLGHTIGFPTANIALDKSRIYPKNGVYSGYLEVEGKRYLAMINLGIHPTVNKLDYEIAEAHVIDEHLDLYDKEVKIIFKEYIRDEKRFNTLDELVNQLNFDKKMIKENAND